MIQWRSKDKIKWIAWREKFSWIRFIAKIRFSRINSPAYSCQMCEAVRGPLQKKKKKREISKENREYSRGGCFNNGARYLHIPVSCFTQNGSNRGHQGPRFARIIAVLSRYATSRYTWTYETFFWKNRLQSYKGQRTMERETERDSVLKYFHCRSSCIFFLFPFKNIVLRVIENMKKNFPVSGRRSRDTEDLYLHDNHELKYSTSLRTNCWKGVPWILNRFDKYLNELIEFSSCSVCFLRVKIWKEDLSVIVVKRKIHAPFSRKIEQRLKSS